MIDILHIDGPELSLLESVDINGNDAAPGTGVVDLDFNTVEFRETSYSVAVYKLAKKYQELVMLIGDKCRKIPSSNVHIQAPKSKRITPRGYSVGPIMFAGKDDLDEVMLPVSIIWRVKPTITPVKNSHGTLVGYQARFRCAVIPDLGEDVWEDFLSIPNPGVPKDCEASE
jgi:hypothetical protein